MSCGGEMLVGGVFTKLTKVVTGWWGMAAGLESCVAVTYYHRWWPSDGWPWS